MVWFTRLTALLHIAHAHVLCARVTGANKEAWLLSVAPYLMRVCEPYHTYSELMAGPALHRGFQFGSHLIPRSQVFLLTPLSFAFTNRKPVLPGRILPRVYVSSYSSMCYGGLEC